jgi:hypothetical protein
MKFAIEIELTPLQALTHQVALARLYPQGGGEGYLAGRVRDVVQGWVRQERPDVEKAIVAKAGDKAPPDLGAMNEAQLGEIVEGLFPELA